MLKDIDITIHVYTKYIEDRMYQFFVPETKNAIDKHALMHIGMYPIADIFNRKINEKALSKTDNDYQLLEKHENLDTGVVLTFIGPNKYIAPEYFKISDTISTIAGCRYCDRKGVVENGEFRCHFYNEIFKREKKRCVGFSQLTIIKS